VWPLLQRFGLRLASLPYGLFMRLRNLGFRLGWFRVQAAGVPVVSVGNLTVGGTGKTPCVEYVAGFYRALGLRVAILSRGYGSATGCNDEALVLEENLPDVPHLQGADRVQLARTAVEELESEVLVLDDGFQHRRLARTLDLVLVDATDPWGQGYLLPRGLLREPPSGLKRADLVLMTRQDQVNEAARERLRMQVGRLAPCTPLIETSHRPVEFVKSDREVAPLSLVGQAPVAAFCGIGNPEAFRRTLIDLGADPVAFRTYPDHHPYTRDDVEDLNAWARGLAPDALIVTTQKDLVKLRLAQLGGKPLWALRVRLHIGVGRDILDRHLLTALTEGP
jgi:tetraacyldisaccharide 4'-kinase